MAFAIRLAKLGDKPLQYDEAQVAYFANVLAETGRYEYLPVLHGPLTYYLEALSFVLLGDSDLTVRLVPALAGTAIVALCAGLQRALGRGAALAAAALLAVSPAFLEYSRFAREDVLYTALALAALVVATRWFEEPRRWHAPAFGALAAACFATKESAFLSVAIVGAGLVGAQIAGWPVLARLRAAGPRPALVAAAVFAIVFAALFSKGFTQPGGIVDGAWHGPRYWAEQHEVNRGGEAWPFYVVVLVAQEWLVLVTGLAGVVVAARRRHPLGLFLTWLAVATLAVYSFAGERFAWLLLQPELPLALLGGLGATVLARRRAMAVALLAGLALTTALALRTSYERATDPRELMVVVHTDEDVRDVVDRVRALRDPGIAVDTSDHTTFPWAWYFRDLRAGYYDMSVAAPPPADVLVMTSDAYALHRDGLPPHEATTFTQRRFWARAYEDLSPADLWRWMTERRTWTPTGELRGVLVITTHQPPPSG